MRDETYEYTLNEAQLEGTLRDWYTPSKEDAEVFTLRNHLRELRGRAQTLLDALEKYADGLEFEELAKFYSDLAPAMRDLEELV